MYGIFKAYTIKEEEHGIKDIFTISQKTEEDKKTSIYTKISTTKLKKIDFLDFLDYYEQIRQKDYEYRSTHTMYGFRVVFYEHSPNWKKKEIYPKHPWQNYILKEIIEKNKKYDNNGIQNKETELIKRNKILAKEIKKLKTLIGKHIKKK